MKIAVITGASSGMGREFVYAIDKEFELDEIWVIARREEKLRELNDRCRTAVRPVALDLLEREVPFFSLKLQYEGDKLVLAVLDGKRIV